MDWFLVGIIGATMYLFGQALGYRHGVRAGQELERIARRVGEITETVRAESKRGPLPGRLLGSAAYAAPPDDSDDE